MAGFLEIRNQKSNKISSKGSVDEIKKRKNELNSIDKPKKRKKSQTTDSMLECTSNEFQNQKENLHGSKEKKLKNTKLKKVLYNMDSSNIPHNKIIPDKAFSQNGYVIESSNRFYDNTKKVKRKKLRS